MKLMSDLSANILERLATHGPDDPIHDCGIALSTLLTDADTCFKLADEKLHVFPFREVKACWFRLFTDASLVKAVWVMDEEGWEDSNLRVSGGYRDSARLDRIVQLLDMALIMAGGLGREEMIHEVFSALRQVTSRLEVGEDEDGEEGRPRKRRKMERESSLAIYKQAGEVDDDDEKDDDDDDVLPLHSTILPKIEFPVQRLHCPSLTEFQKHMDTIKQPVILTGTIDHWPALTEWQKPSYWMSHTLNGRRLVPVELGRTYTDEDWGQKIMPFGDFLQNHILHPHHTDKAGEKEEQDPPPPPPPPPSKPSSSTSSSTSTLQTGYLAQHDLLRQIPSLRSSSTITTPDYCHLDPPAPDPGTPVYLSRLKSCTQPPHPTSVSSYSEGEIQSNIWLGPAWTISPLHHDPHHNLLCQVVGTKYIRLYSPHSSERLSARSEREVAPHRPPLQQQQQQPHPDPGSAAAAEEEEDDDDVEKRVDYIDMSNTSHVPLHLMETSPAEDWESLYPGFGAVPYVECILAPGEVLYIPVGWWHYVRSCSTAVSVSFWWGGGGGGGEDNARIGK